MAENKPGVRKTTSRTRKPVSAAGNAPGPPDPTPEAMQEPEPQLPTRAPITTQATTTRSVPACRSCFYFEAKGGEVMMNDGTMRGNRSAQNALGACHATSALHARKPSDWCGEYRGESAGIPGNLQ